MRRCSSSCSSPRSRRWSLIFRLECECRVVVEIMLGIVVGPHVLGLATPDDLVEVLSEFGLAFLFFFAGMEIDFDRMRGRPLTLAARGWACRWCWEWPPRPCSGRRG